MFYFATFYFFKSKYLGKKHLRPVMIRLIDIKNLNNYPPPPLLLKNHPAHLGSCDLKHNRRRAYMHFLLHCLSNCLNWPIQADLRLQIAICACLDF